MAHRTPAEVFPPGEYIKEELEARGWTQSDLAEIMGRPPRVISEIISTKRSVTPETARGLSEAFGTSAQLWLNLESAYQLWKLESPTDTVRRRARLYEKAPIKEMIRRGWIEASDNVAVLERQVLDFFGAKSIDDEFTCPGVAARKSGDYAEDTSSQVAWFARCKILARAVDAKPYKASDGGALVSKLKPLFANVEDVRRIPQILAESGIRFLIVAPLIGSRVDGACFWLDARSPVVVVSLRIDTIDGLWFTVMHECAHVMRGDGLKTALPLDIDLVGPSRKGEETSDIEREANLIAGESLIPKAELDNFIQRNRPMFYRERVEGFAKRIGVHPGIVNGQLHHHAGLSWKFNREFHAKVRHLIVSSALTDGYGCEPPTLLPQRSDQP